MKVSQLIRQANRDIDDSFENIDHIDWMNRCLAELSSIAKIEKKATATRNETDVYTLPSDFYQMSLVVIDKKEILPIPVKDFTNQGYKLWGKEIEIQNGPDTGNIDLYYYRKFNTLTSIDDEPELEESFQDLLILYAIIHSQFMDEENERQQDAVLRYQARKEEYRSFITGQQGPDEIRVVY